MLNKMFVTVFYSGLSPKASGTVGSFVALLFAIFILKYFNIVTLLLLTILVTIIAFKQVDIYEEKTSSHDSKEIVIDELIGMWIAIIIAGGGIIELALAFIYFRLFDIYKPSIIGRVDKMQGSFSVIVDDIIAGFFGGLSTLITIHLYNKLYELATNNIIF